MGRPNTGPRLKVGAGGIHYITWSEDRRTKRVSTRTANLLEAQKVLGGFLLEQEKAAEAVTRMTVGAVIDYYDANHIEEKVIDKAKQRLALSRIRASLGEDRFMDELAGDDFVKYSQARRKTKTHKGEPTNDATIRRELVSFIAAINYAVKNRKMENRHAPVIGLPSHNSAKDRWLEREEAQRLLAAAQGEATRLTPLYRLVAIGLSTAKRRRAIENLKWFQVDLKNRVIDFRKPNSPETKKKKGMAPISDWLLPILERAYREKTSEYVLDTPSALTRPFARTAHRIGMGEVTPHTLRHTWGTWAAQGGASMWAIAGVIGCTVETATRNYLHHSPAHLRNVADSVSPEIMNVAAPVVIQGGKA